MRKILLFVGLQLAVFGLAGLKAQDAGLAAKPAKAPVAAHLGSEDAPTVGWFFTSEEPRRERQIAQTVFVPQKASVRHLAIQVAGAGLSGLNDASFYQLKVYESGQKPEKTFLNQPVMLNQSGLIKDSNGEWLVFPFGEPLNLKANHYYTFALQLLNPAPAHRVIFKHSQPEQEGLFRWHRQNRDSWVPARMSLHFMLY